MFIKKFKRILIGLGILLLIVVGYLVYRGVCIGTAYKAKTLCSGVFVSLRTPESVLSQDLGVDDLSILKYFNADINFTSQTVTSNLFGLAKRTALYRKGLGCTLVIDTAEEKLRAQAAGFDSPGTQTRKDLLWPDGEMVRTEPLPREIKKELLGRAVDEVFSEPDPKRLRRTRAVVVVYQGRIVAERYAPGITTDTPLIGWSMTKSVMNALTGIMVREGKLSIHDTALLPQWRAPDDPRSSISVDHLLRMTSGLKFDENYVNLISDVNEMLLDCGDMASFAADKSLKSAPGSAWKYSSGSINILSRVIRDRLGGTASDYFDFPRKALFNPVGMHSAVIEPDAAGNFVGSSFMYATARDWARFGLLYLRKGRWNGKQILPADWTAYSLAPTTGSENAYGAGFWLRPDPPTGGQSRALLPSDAYFITGHEGQLIAVIPPYDLVIVRLGLSRLPGAWDHALFASRVLEAF
jgi:CubicO group peptidase (beta-lactamase class C family)